jgi:hypothetical protein
MYEPESKPVSSGPTGRLWTIYRQDDNGNVFIVQDDVSQEEAERLVALFTSRGHKQLYTAQPK